MDQIKINDTYALVELNSSEDIILEDFVVTYSVYDDDNENHWDLVKLETDHCHLDEKINEDNIISSYIILLNKNKEVLLTFDNEWKFPGGHLKKRFTLIDDDFKHQLIEMVFEQIGLHIKINQLIGLKKYYKSIQSNMAFAGTDQIIKYTTFYLAEINDNYTNDSFLSNLYMDTLNKSQKTSYFQFSRLIDMPIYFIYKQLFSVIYDPLKLQLLIDLDHTLLESARLTETKQVFDSITTDDYVLKNHFAPDAIIPMYGYLRYVWTRPFLREFLKIMSELTHISYWTAGSYSCQDAVINAIKIKDYAKQSHYNDVCTIENNSIYKSISDLNNKLRTPIDDSDYYNLNKTLLIDDLPLNKIHNKYNCFQIKQWSITESKSCHDLINNLADQQLAVLIFFIKYISDQVIHYGETVPSIFQKMEQLNEIPPPSVIANSPPEQQPNEQAINAQQIELSTLTEDFKSLSISTEISEPPLDMVIQTET